MNNKQKRGNPLLLVLILILVLVFVFSGLRFLESTFSPSDSTDPTTPSKTIIRDGVAYFPRQDVTTILLAGIDEFGEAQDSGSYNNTGAADMVWLLIFDETNEKLDILSLNRDTMLNIPVLGLGGKPAGTTKAQLALAHTYGSGLEDSAQNLRNAVSGLLYQFDIDYYVTLRMDAIRLLNDAVGGVEVEVTDDFSAVDPSIPMGRVTLNGQQALNFVRTRQGVGDQLNLSRMQRQTAYATGFISALRTAMDGDSGFTASTYDAVSPYMVTDCSLKSLAAMGERYRSYSLGETVAIRGENVENEFMEYHLDEKDLDRVILQYLYAPK